MNAREEVRQSRLGVRRLKARLQETAQRVDATGRERDSLQERLDVLNGNSEARHITTSNIIIYAIVILLYPAVYCLDFLLFGPTAELLAEKVSAELPALTWGARFCVPALIIVIEMFLAMKIFMAKREADQYYSSHGAYSGWLIAGIVFNLVMPFLVISTSTAQIMFESETMQKATNWQLAASVVLAFIPHMAIVLSGRISHEAKSYIAFRIQRGILQRKIKRYSNMIDRDSQLFKRDFDLFYDLLTRHQNSYEPDYNAGPFDNTTRNFARNIFGYDVIQGPDNGSSTIHVQGDGPVEGGHDISGNNPPDEGGESDPWIRDQESEVRL
jgi:hypothetical protein